MEIRDIYPEENETEKHITMTMEEYAEHTLKGKRTVVSVLPEFFRLKMGRLELVCKDGVAVANSKLYFDGISMPATRVKIEGRIDGIWTIEVELLPYAGDKSLVPMT